MRAELRRFVEADRAAVTPDVVRDLLHEADQLARRRLLVTDLDNTLWDWFEPWYESFTA